MRNRNVALICLTLASALVYCGRPLQPTSNLGITNEAAQADLKFRMKKTEEIRVKLGNVRSALSSLDAVLSDVAQAVDSRVEGADTGRRIRQLFDRLRGALAQATRGLIETRADGSSAIVQNLKLALGREAYECKSGVLTVTDKKEGDLERITVLMNDCYSKGDVVLAEALVLADGNVEATFYPERLEKLLPEQPSAGERKPPVCTTSRNTLHCDPFTLHTPKYDVSFRVIDVARDQAGITARIDADALDANGKGFELAVSATPGTQTKIQLRDK